MQVIRGWTALRVQCAREDRSYLQPHDQRQILAVSIVEPPEHVGPVPHLHVAPGFSTGGGGTGGEPCSADRGHGQGVNTGAPLTVYIANKRTT